MKVAVTLRVALKEEDLVRFLSRSSNGIKTFVRDGDPLSIEDALALLRECTQGQRFGWSMNIHTSQLSLWEEAELVGEWMLTDDR